MQNQIFFFRTKGEKINQFKLEWYFFNVFVFFVFDFFLGKFTAPLDGVFVFNAQVMYHSAAGGGWISWVIVKNDTWIALNEVTFMILRVSPNIKENVWI